MGRAPLWAAGLVLVGCELIGDVSGYRPAATGAVGGATASAGGGGAASGGAMGGASASGSTAGGQRAGGGGSWAPPECDPACEISDVCCVAVDDTEADCRDNSNQCQCDPASGAPCAGSFPVCCDLFDDRYPGTPRCRDHTNDCVCDPGTNEPCMGTFGVCCDPGGGRTPHCQSSCS